MAGLNYKGTPTPTQVYSAAAENGLNYDTAYNYPNPFSDKTTIRFNMDEISEVSVRIYDSNGSLVWNRNISAGNISYGTNNISWDGANDSGIPASNGVYIMEIKTEKASVRKKIAIIR